MVLVLVRSWLYYNNKKFILQIEKIKQLNTETDGNPG